MIIELVKNIIGIYFFQKESYLNLVKKSLLPLPIAVLLIFLNSLWSAFSLFPKGIILWWFVIIQPFLSIFLAYLLADIVHSQGEKILGESEFDEPTTRDLFCLYSVFTIPGFIFSYINRLMINIIYNYSLSWLIIFIVLTTLTIYLGFRWYFFSIKTLFELTWKNSLKLGLKAYLIYLLYYSLIAIVVYFFMITLGMIDLPLPYYYKFFFGYLN